MSLLQQLTSDQIAAMKAKDAQKLSVLRMINSAVKTLQIDTDHELTDVEVQDVIRRQVKQLTDATNDFAAAKREDLVAQTQAEIAILATYLPTQLSEEVVKERARQIIETLKADGAALNVGTAMAAVMKELKGQADGTVVRNVVSQLVS